LYVPDIFHHQALRQIILLHTWSMKKQTGPEGHYHMRKKQVKTKKANPWESMTAE
jgi:hypothetical protein